MKKYLFIDGGFMEAMIPKTESFFGMQLPRTAQFDYRAIAGEFARTFYYDALPSRKDGETEEAFNLKLAAKMKLFERINRTPFMHTREGITRSRSPKRVLQQKGVDILLAIDVFKHASLHNISEAHIMTKDLDFFPLFEALRDTPVSVHLHCDTDETTEELMSLADVVVPITPFTIIRWLRQSDVSDEKYVERNIHNKDNLPVEAVVKEGTCDGQPFRIYKVERENMPPAFVGHSMALEAQRVIVSEKWEYIVADFEDRLHQRIYFDA